MHELFFFPFVYIGWLPLHWAATFHKSPAVISAIIEAYPEALHKETHKGKTPYQCVRSSKQRAVLEKGIDIAADRGIDVNPPRIFATVPVKEGDGPRGGMLGGNDSSGSLGSIGDIFASLGRRKSRNSKPGSARNAPWEDNDAGGSGGNANRRSSLRGDTLRRRRRSTSGDALPRSSSNASLSIEEAILQGGGSGGRGGSSGTLGSRGSRGENNPPRRRRRSTSLDAVTRAIGKLMNSDQSLLDDEAIQRGEASALISEYVNPGDVNNDAGEERKDEYISEGKSTEESGDHKRSKSFSAVLNDVVGDDDSSPDSNRRSKSFSAVLNDVDGGDGDSSPDNNRTRRGRRRSRSTDSEHSVKLTSMAAIDSCKEGAPSRGRDHEPHRGDRERQHHRRRSRSRSIDTLNRVIKAVGVKSFELVETDAADDRPVMERKSSAKLA
jgi:hypothetical protein